MVRLNSMVIMEYRLTPKETLMSLNFVDVLNDILD